MGSIEPANLGKWFECHGSALVLYARQWLSAAEAEDAVQDVFVKLMGLSAPPAAVKPWLYKAVRHRAISRWRSKQRRLRREQKVMADRPDFFDARPDDLIDAKLAQAALGQLPDDQREIVTLRIWADLTLEQIADIVNLSVATVFRKHRSALSSIRQRLESTCKTNRT